MKMCSTHWQLCRDTIDQRGLTPLVSKNAQEAAERIEHELKGGTTASFDPLMSMHNHFMGEALRNGGLYLMAQNDDGSNDGHYCPICEFEKHGTDFNAKEAVEGIADEMVKYAREQKLLPPLQ